MKIRNEKIILPFMLKLMITIIAVGIIILLGFSANVCVYKSGPDIHKQKGNDSSINNFTPSVLKRLTSVPPKLPVTTTTPTNTTQSPKTNFSRDIEDDDTSDDTFYEQVDLLKPAPSIKPKTTKRPEDKYGWVLFYDYYTGEYNYKWVKIG